MVFDNLKYANVSAKHAWFDGKEACQKQKLYVYGVIHNLKLHFLKYLTSFPPLTIKPWKSPQNLFIFCFVNLPSPSGMTSYIDDPIARTTTVAFKLLRPTVSENEYHAPSK